MKDQVLPQISDSEIFYLWIELGSITKVVRNLANRGIINKRTGKPLHYTCIWDHGMKWVVENPENARIIYEAKLERKFTDEQWNRWIVKKALKVFDDSHAQLKDWIKRHGMERYSDIYSKRFPTGIVD